MPTIPAEKSLEMATIDWARSLGLPDEIGSIEVGRKAGLVLFDTKRPKWCSLINPVTNLVYNADGRSVHSVIVDGRVAVENHAPTFVNTWELIQRVQGLDGGCWSGRVFRFRPVVQRIRKSWGESGVEVFGRGAAHPSTGLGRTKF